MLPAKSLRSAIGWLGLALLYTVGVSFYRGEKLAEATRSGLAAVERQHPAVLSLFQSSFYFFYEDQFLPGLRDSMEKIPDLRQVQILSKSGGLIFDSAEAPQQAPDRPKEFPFKEVIDRLSHSLPSSFVDGFDIQILVPSGEYGILYSFDGSRLRRHLFLVFILGLALITAGAWAATRIDLLMTLSKARERWARFWGLRAKFLFTILLINSITGAIVFFTLAELQTREQTHRIERESVLFSRFSTAQVVSNFINSFYFNYSEKFLPGVRSLIASNENLVGIRVVSGRTKALLFDSEVAGSKPVLPAEREEAPKAAFTSTIEQQLAERDLVTRPVFREGEKYFSVINTYRGDNDAPLFFVEYLFSFKTLANSIAAIRRQILVDLIPSMTLGLIIAAIFAQFLISPIRRLVAALRQVSAGEYDVSVETKRSDEIGELVSTFNTMTFELKKKKELRKYLSDSTYRQIMESPERPEGTQLGGTRVQATVLMSDIRSFVALCESMEAEEVTAMLNEYFSQMVEVVHRHGGEVDKFIGDALLAVFYASEESHVFREGSPSPSPTTTSLQAIYCALEMRDRLSEFNKKRVAAGKSPIEIGVGITYGEIISGPIGSKDRMDFTVIGSVVNLASRIEKLSKRGRHTRIVFSSQVEDKVRGLLDYEEIKTDIGNQFDEQTSVFELIKVRDLNDLVAYLDSKDANLRQRSVELLGQSRNAEAIPHALRALEDPDEDVRLHAVLALSKLSAPDEPRVVSALLSKMNAEKSTRLLSAIISVLGRLCRNERILEIARYLEAPDDRIVANAVEALGQVQLPRCQDLILPKLTSLNNRVKANAAMALFASGRIEVLGILKPMLMASDARMRSSAAFAIGELTLLAQRDNLVEVWKSHPQGLKAFLGELQECVPMLVSLLKDGDPSVKRQAVIALGKIRDKSSVLAILDNIDLTSDSKELLKDLAHALHSIGSHKLVREVVQRLS